MTKSCSGNMLYIDFETYSQADLKAVGAWNYSLHASTDVFCMAYAEDNGPIKIWTPSKDDNTELRWFFGCTMVEAHNAFFERSIYENIMVPRYGFQELLPRQWHCSAAICAARGLPRSLELAAKTVKLPLQ